MIITIDGPIATGKSTIAKQLAKEIGFIYFDTGAMYRSVAFAALKHQINIDNSLALKEFLDHFVFDLKIKQGERFYFVEGEDVTLKIRTEKVTSFASKMAALPQVREKLLSIQREFSLGVNAVFEGRDMGTVVFPEAQLKIFLTGDDHIRAKRRFQELCQKFPEDAQTFTLEKVLEEIRERDALDSSREFSPLKKAEDAIEIDTSNLSLDEIVFKILEARSLLKTKKS